MSWNVKNVGTKDQVIAAIDQAVGKYGMPEPVCSYLKGAIDVIDLPPGYLVMVESSGHRPNSTSTETCKVEVVKNGPWNLK